MDAGVKKYCEVYFVWKTHVLPQGSSGTGQFQDWTDDDAAGISKDDINWSV